MNEKIKKITLEKKIVIGELILVVGILVYLFFSSTPTQIYPLQGMTITEPDFVFEIEDGEQVVISTNQNFDSEIVLTEGSDVTLAPGTYYWKVRSMIRESDVRIFTIQSQTGLNLNENKENYELENSGNVDLNVSKKDKGFTTSFTLNIGESENLEKDNSTYEGEQK